MPIGLFSGIQALPCRDGSMLVVDDASKTIAHTPSELVHDAKSPLGLTCAGAEFQETEDGKARGNY